MARAKQTSTRHKCRSSWFLWNTKRWTFFLILMYYTKSNINIYILLWDKWWHCSVKRCKCITVIYRQLSFRNSNLPNCDWFLWGCWSQGDLLWLPIYVIDITFYWQVMPKWAPAITWHMPHHKLYIWPRMCCGDSTLAWSTTGSMSKSYRIVSSLSWPNILYGWRFDSLLYLHPMNAFIYNRSTNWRLFCLNNFKIKSPCNFLSEFFIHELLLLHIAHKKSHIL